MQASIASDSTSIMRPVRFTGLPREDYEAYRFARACSHDFGVAVSPIHEGPPPGAGIGSTPSTGPELREQRRRDEAITSPALSSSVEVIPLSEQQVEHVMINLSERYFMQIDEHEHVSWLLLRRLIREQDAHEVLRALSVPQRPAALTPNARSTT